jgi:nucleoid DNA-binding protein
MKRKVVAKTPVVKLLAKKADIPYAQASFVYDVLMEIIYDELREGTSVILPHIATLGIVNTKSQISHLTGQTIPPHKRLKFKPNIYLAKYVRVNTREYKIK